MIPFLRCICLLAGLVIALAAADTRMVQAGNLIYAGDQTSVCFSDRFLTTVQVEAGIPTEKRLRAVRLAAAEELFSIPFVIMTGQEAFELPEQEQEHLRSYLDNGGFLVASAGCSSEEFTASFRSSMEAVFGPDCLQPLTTSNPLFRTLFPIDSLPLKSGGQAQLEGIVRDGRLVCLFSKEGLNDTAHTQGCCCCGGNEIKNAEEVVANALVYALVE